MPHATATLRNLLRNLPWHVFAVLGLVIALVSTATEIPAAAPATSTPTATASLNHFLCYQISRGNTGETVNLTTNQFGSTSALVRRAQHLCAPASKEGEDPTAPADPDHLTGYSLRTEVPFGRQFDQVVVNQFGTLTVDLIPPVFLFVPTGKSTSGPPASYTPAIDHFECVRTVHARFKRSGIDVADQFGTRTVNVRRPTRLCVPVDKDGSGITDPSASLMCYRVSGKPRLNDTHVFATNQFADEEYDVGVVRELCVPSLLNPGAPTATPVTTATPTPTEGPTETATPEPTETATPGPTETATPEPTETATPEPTETATPEPTETPTPEPTETATPEPTETATPEPTETATPEPTETATPEPTETATPDPTPTSTPACGDGSPDAGEDCDDGNTTSCDGCSKTCTTEGCGDGTQCASEDCDDGNTTACDGCSPTCAFERCGDGIVCPNEGCDPPGSTCDNFRTCASDCTCPAPTCGDFITDASEQCDDGNTTACDGCSATCQTEPSCDDGVTCTIDSCDPGTGACVHQEDDESCDDGNETTLDRCDPGCSSSPYCEPTTGCVNEPGGGCGCS